MSEAPKQPVLKPKIKAFDLLKRAQEGDASILPELQDIMKDRHLVEEIGGNLAKQAEKALLTSMYGKNLLFHEAVTQKLRNLRTDLTGTNSTPLESLLIERIVMCWVQLYNSEIRFQQADGMTIPQGEYHQRKIERHHKQYLSAIKTLATVRKLAIPILIGQVNIATKQVNKSSTTVG